MTASSQQNAIQKDFSRAVFSKVAISRFSYFRIRILSLNLFSNEMQNESDLPGGSGGRCDGIFSHFFTLSRLVALSLPTVLEQMVGKVFYPSYIQALARLFSPFAQLRSLIPVQAVLSHNLSFLFQCALCVQLTLTHFRFRAFVFPCAWAREEGEERREASLPPPS